MTTRKADFWDAVDEADQLRCTTRHEAIEYAVGCMHFLPDTIELNGYARVKIDADHYHEDCLTALLERLDEEFGDPDECHKKTSTMKFAAREFVEAVLDEFVAWRCDLVSSEEVDLEKWVKEHDPDRMNDFHG